MISIEAFELMPEKPAAADATAFRESIYFNPMTDETIVDWLMKSIEEVA
jgi:hypothetical protein